MAQDALPDESPAPARSLAGRTLLITGATRGIGLAIARRAAQDGANIALIGKTDRPHRVLPGTIHTAAEEIEAAGGHALPLAVDLRDADRVSEAVERVVERFGALDILVNNASAIQLTGTLDTAVKRFDLMHQVNARGSFVASQASLPHLLDSGHAHILTLSPPLDLDPRWFGPHVAYSMAKFGMSLLTLGLSEEFRGRIGINALWPRTVIDTAALRVLDFVDRRRARHATIVADAAHAILTRDPRTATGRFFIDEEVLREEGVTDFTPYAVDPSRELQLDLYVRAGS
ncbi:MAG: NAD(P)-dependent oxidoreductase [Planctomycetes bacterium]|nr:NAD(P)-dependent oxidoreductase [Planctomycetota bacterium]